MAWMARGIASVALCEYGARRPDAFVQGGVAALGEDEAFVDAHLFCIRLEHSRAWMAFVSWRLGVFFCEQRV